MVNHSLFARLLPILVIFYFIFSRAAEPAVLELPQQRFAQSHVAVHEFTRVIASLSFISFKRRLVANVSG